MHQHLEHRWSLSALGALATIFLDQRLGAQLQPAQHHAPVAGRSAPAGSLGLQHGHGSAALRQAEGAGQTIPWKQIASLIDAGEPADLIESKRLVMAAMASLAPRKAQTWAASSHH